MARTLSVESESFPIAGAFTISRGSKTEAHVITCTIGEGAVSGCGECVPYARYGETLAGVRAEIEAARAAIESGCDRQSLLTLMRPGAARNAVDCALWDFEAKSGARLPELSRLEPLTTAFTLSLADSATLAAQARAESGRPLLKVKVGTADDVPLIRAVCGAAPESRIILDANEGWTEENVRENLAVAAECGVALVEQPLPAGHDGLLKDIARPVPVCADESVHSDGDLDRLAGLYDAVNIKLDKTGGLTAALAMRDRARALGFKVMVGCMVGSSLGMAPAIVVAQGADFVDLDGPLLLARDRAPGLRYDGSTLFPPQPELWG